MINNNNDINVNHHKLDNDNSGTIVTTGFTTTATKDLFTNTCTAATITTLAPNHNNVDGEGLKTLLRLDLFVCFFFSCFYTNIF